MNAMDRMIDAQRIPGHLSRSWLLVPAHRPETFNAALSSRADQLIFDVEDAVPPALKEASRELALEWMLEGGRSWVRVNAYGSPYWLEDLHAFAQAPGLLGVVLAKAESAEAMIETRAVLGENIPVIPLVESALGIEEAVAIARAGAYRLAFGSGDYRRDTGVSADALAMAYPRSRLVIASRLAMLPGPIDGPAVASAADGSMRLSEDAVALGMTGQLCLRPEQARQVNKRFSPTDADIEWASRFLEAYADRGGVVRDGSDLPNLARATRIQDLAAAFRVVR